MMPEHREPHERPEFTQIAQTKLWSSFHYAFQGILYAAKTQPNMRIHLIVAALVLVATLWLRVDRSYVIAIIVMIALVISLELVNTAVEAIVDLLTVAHHPLAKTAKDAAAGAVLIATIGAVIVGYLVFYQSVQRGGQRVFDAIGQVPTNTAFIILALAAIATLFAKAYVGRGSPLQGGAVSGHSALAFAGATMLALFYQHPLPAIIGYFVAGLVAQSRVEARIHSVGEVTWGGLIGVGVAVGIYLLVRPHVVL